MVRSDLVLSKHDRAAHDGQPCIPSDQHQQAGTQYRQCDTQQQRDADYRDLRAAAQRTPSAEQRGSPPPLSARVGRRRHHIR